LGKELVTKVVTIPAIAAKKVKVTGCHNCPFAIYKNGMSDSRGYYCSQLEHTNHGWGLMINPEVRENKFAKECPL